MKMRIIFLNQNFIKFNILKYHLVKIVALANFRFYKIKGVVCN